MSLARFDDECPGCRPTMMDVKTGRLFADDSAAMVAVNRLWAATSPEERQAWHRFTCQNSRAPGDLILVKAFSDRVQAALTALTKKEDP